MTKDIIQAFIKLGCPVTNNGYYLYDIAKWLRGSKNLFIEIELYADCELNIVTPYIYQFYIYKDCVGHPDREFYDSYEEALETGIWEAHKLLSK